MIFVYSSDVRTTSYSLVKKFIFHLYFYSKIVVFKFSLVFLKLVSFILVISCVIHVMWRFNMFYLNFCYMHAVIPEVIPDRGTNPAKGFFSARFEYTRKSPLLSSRASQVILCIMCYFFCVFILYYFDMCYSDMEPKDRQRLLSGDFFFF